MWYFWLGVMIGIVYDQYKKLFHEMKQPDIPMKNCEER